MKCCLQDGVEEDLLATWSMLLHHRIGQVIARSCMHACRTAFMRMQGSRVHRTAKQTARALGAKHTFYVCAAAVAVYWPMGAFWLQGTNCKTGLHCACGDGHSLTHSDSLASLTSLPDGCTWSFCCMHANSSSSSFCTVRCLNLLHCLPVV
jgi:hypothetical protein